MRTLKIIFLVFLTIAAAFNLFQSFAQAFKQLNDRTTVPLHSLSFQFQGLEKVFKNVRTIGYYTDKNLDHPLAIAQFEQAQYVLAPTVLKLNDTKQSWVIIDCTTPKAGMEAIQRLGLTPLKANNGIILAANPSPSVNTFGGDK